MARIPRAPLTCVCTMAVVAPIRPPRATVAITARRRRLTRRAAARWRRLERYADGVRDMPVAILLVWRPAERLPRGITVSTAARRGTRPAVIFQARRWGESRPVGGWAELGVREWPRRRTTDEPHWFLTLRAFRPTPTGCRLCRRGVTDWPSARREANDDRPARSQALFTDVERGQPHYPTGSR